MNVYRRLIGLAAAMVAAVVTVGVGDVWAAGEEQEGDTTCQSGSIATGVYSNLKIAGACTVQSGSVTVKHNLTVLPGASLVAVTGGFGFGGVPISSDITVGGNLEVQTNGILVLGCEPIYFNCANDPDQKIGTFATKDTIVGNLMAENALAVIVHRTTIGQNVLVSGGGSGVSSCGEKLPALQGAPPYGDFEDDVIGGSLSIKGWQSCWLGWARDTVLDDVEFDGNVTGDPDGNEMLNDTVVGNLSCSGNNPSRQLGDSGGGPTTVLGKANGQCAFKPGLVVH